MGDVFHGCGSGGGVDAIPSAADRSRDPDSSNLQQELREMFSLPSVILSIDMVGAPKFASQIGAGMNTGAWQMVH